MNKRAHVSLWGVSALDFHLTVMAEETRLQDSGHLQGRAWHSPSLALRYSGFEEAYSGPSGPSGCLKEKRGGTLACDPHRTPGVSDYRPPLCK